MKEIAMPDVTPRTGKTFLSVKQIDGNIFIVDQDGDLINGLISCKASTSFDEGTTLELKAYSHKID